MIQKINEKTKKKRVRKIHKKEDGKIQCSGDACDMIEQGTKVRVMLDAPVNVHDSKKLHGRFRETDIRWNIKPKTVMKTLLAPGNPPMYLLDNDKGEVDYRTSYTKNQLQIIPKDEKKPVESDIAGQKVDGQKRWIVEKIIDRKKIKNRVFFVVKWKGFKDPTEEPRATLIKQIPEMVKEFEQSLVK